LVLLTIERLDFNKLPAQNKLWASQKQEKWFHSKKFSKRLGSSSESYTHGGQAFKLLRRHFFMNEFYLHAQPNA